MNVRAVEALAQELTVAKARAEGQPRKPKMELMPIPALWSGGCRTRSAWRSPCATKATAARSASAMPRWTSSEEVCRRLAAG